MMRLGPLALLVGLLVAPVDGANADPATRRSSPPRPVKELPASITVPIELISNLPFLPVRVNGSEVLNGILDSGAGISVVSPQHAMDLGLLSTGSVKAGGFGQGADQTLHLVEQTDLSVGTQGNELTLPHQTIAVLPIDYIGSQTGHPTDALFGSNLFKNFRITLNYARQTATFAPFGAPWHVPAVAIPIDVSGNVPIVDVTLTGENGAAVTARFVVDIGTTGALIMSRQFLDAHPQLTEGHAWVKAPSASAVGGSIDFNLIRLTGLTLGPFRLKAPIAAVPAQASGVLATPGLAGLLGGEVLNRFTVSWDYQHEQMWLVPNGRLHRLFKADASGLHLIARGTNLDEIYIDEVLPRSSADRAGLRAGDRVVEVNGRAPKLWKLGELFTHSGTTVSLSILRGSAPRRLKLHLQALL